MIAVTAVYGFMLLGTLGVIATSNWSGDNSDEPGITTSYDGNAIAAPTFQPGRLSQLLTTSTDGHNKATEPMASAKAAPPARVPVPEVDEMAEIFPERAHPSSQASAAPAAQGSDALVENGWDFNDPDSIPGFASMPQPDAAPSTDGRRLARAKR